MVDEPRELSVPKTLLTVSTTERDDVVIVSMAGELDMTTADRAATALKTAATRGATLIVDLTGLEFFSSAGLNLLLQLHEDARENHITVLIAGDQRAVFRPLELTGLAELFPIHATLADALEACR
jgi:anti-anti-sigma factor